MREYGMIQCWQEYGLPRVDQMQTLQQDDLTEGYGKVVREDHVGQGATRAAMHSVGQRRTAFLP